MNEIFYFLLFVYLFMFIYSQMGYLEEIKTSKAMGNSFASTTTSTATGTTTTSDGALGNSSVNSSPKSITDVVTEAQKKGSLLDRVSHLENRVLKVSI